MDAKHTPGPWRVSGENPTHVIEDRLPLYKEGRLISKANGHPDSGFFPSEEEAIYNARLIAAAPELLEALQKILPLAEEALTHPDLSVEILDARVAIAKATRAWHEHARNALDAAPLHRRHGRRDGSV